MMFAIFNNITEIILGITWSTITFMAGQRFGRWRQRRAGAKQTHDAE